MYRGEMGVNRRLVGEIDGILVEDKRESTLTIDFSLQRWDEKLEFSMKMRFKMGNK